jgi:phosphonate C-P lyase system protein PhnG
MREIETSEILAEIGEEPLAQLLALIPDDLELVGVPRDGIVLMTRREGLGTRFHLGEVLASNCRVRWQGSEGWGMVIGGDPRKALVAAACDAMDKIRPAPQRLSEFVRILDIERSILARRRLEQARLTASTRVDFDLLPGA